jgi:hypothetical protein
MNQFTCAKIRVNNGKIAEILEISAKRYKTPVAAISALARAELPFDTRLSRNGAYWTIAAAEDVYGGVWLTFRRVFRYYVSHTVYQGQVAITRHIDADGNHSMLLRYPDGTVIDVWDAANDECPPTPPTYEIGFCRCARTGNYIVSWRHDPRNRVLHRRRQEIIVLPRAFFRILPQVDRRAVAGCTDATAEQLAELGFVVTPLKTGRLTLEWEAAAAV